MTAQEMTRELCPSFIDTWETHFTLRCYLTNWGISLLSALFVSFIMFGFIDCFGSFSSRVKCYQGLAKCQIAIYVAESNIGARDLYVKILQKESDHVCACAHTHISTHTHTGMYIAVSFRRDERDNSLNE